MAADPTLVQGARLVGQSMVPLDLKEFYKAQYEMQTTWMANVQTFFKTKGEEAERQMGVLTDKYDLAASALASSGRIGAAGEYDALMEQYEGVTERYKTALKSKDKKTQHKLEGEATRISQQIQRLETGYGAINDLLKENEIDARGTGDETFAVLNQIWDKDGDPTKIKHIWEDGFLTYEVNTGNLNYGEDGIVKIKADDLMQAVVPIAHGEIGKMLGFGKQYRESGAQGGAFYFDDVKYEVKSGVFKTKKGFAGLVNTKWGRQKKSFKEAIIVDQRIWDALNELDPTDIAKFDVVKDGKIDAKDFAKQGNAVGMIDALTNINSPNFEKEIAYDLAADYYTQGIQEMWQEGKKIYDEKPSGNKGTPTQTERNQATLASQVKRLDTQVTWNKVNWKRAAVNIDGTDTSVYYAEYEGGTDIMTPYGLQAQAGSFASQDYPEDLKILNPAQLEQVQTQLTEQGLEFGEGGPGEINEANIKSLISGSEAQVVSAFNDSEMFEGYAFTKEWEGILGGKHMNMKLPGWKDNDSRTKIINLNSAIAAQQIMDFIKANPI